MRAELSVARIGKVLTKSMFSGYDLCINPYVGCEFGCSYCYVRFMVKDDKHDWGEFVRIRKHIKDRLPKELDKANVKIENGHMLVNEPDKAKKKTIYKVLPICESRLVLGTMTDPYQPAEKKHRITRETLEILVSHTNQFKKVGIFTRSPLIMHDIELIKKLPKARVHFTVTPFQPHVLRAIEPYASITSRRWDTIKALKEAGIRVHVNVSPVIPFLSDGFEEEFVNKLIDLQVDEYFCDPMQAYKESWIAFKRSIQNVDDVDSAKIEQMMCINDHNKDRYLDWKFEFYQKWNNIRKELQHKAPHQLPIWSDHENKVWVNMITGEQMSKRVYGDEK